MNSLPTPRSYWKGRKRFLPRLFMRCPAKMNWTKGRPGQQIRVAGTLGKTSSHDLGERWDQWKILSRFKRVRQISFGQTYPCWMRYWSDYRLGCPAYIFFYQRRDRVYLARLEHERWMNEKIEQGWRYGSVRDDIQKIHPSLVTYDKLSEKEKDKDRNTIHQIPQVALLHSLPGISKKTQKLFDSTQLLTSSLILGATFKVSKTFIQFTVL